MSFVIDLIIIVVAVTAILHGVAKGFIKSAMRFVSIILALILTSTFTPALASWLDEAYMNSQVSAVVENALDSIVEMGSERLDFEEVLNDQPEALLSLAERFNIDISDIESYYTGALDDLTESDALAALSSEIAAPTSSTISTVCAAIIIFVGTMIVGAIVALILDLLCRLPVLKQLNRTLGALFGVANALLCAWIIANISVGLINALEAMQGSVFNESVIESSLILKLFVDAGLILF